MKNYQKNGAERGLNYPFIKTSVYIFIFSLAFAGCKKQQDVAKEGSASTVITREATVINGDENPVLKYQGLEGQTIEELKTARAATALYQNINNAFSDGYVDIQVRVENMGYHFMRANNVDGKFDPAKPEILVYNKTANGGYELLAVEYAVPLSLSQNAPEGFTGSNDVWERNETFGLWLCHAWVWSFNPDGVFHDTNPLINVL